MTAESSALPGSDRGGALEGVVVVELAQSLAGDFAGGLLADMGATVVKVELATAHRFAAAVRASPAKTRSTSSRRTAASTRSSPSFPS